MKKFLKKYPFQHVCLLGCIGITLLFSACQKEEDLFPSEADAINLVTSIVPRTTEVQMRAAIAENGTGSFEAGDAISVYVQTPSSLFEKELVRQASAWTPTLRWRDFQADQAHFTAIFPTPIATVSEAQEINLQVPVNQSTSENYQLADALVAHTTAQRGENVHLAFQHVMNRVVVVLTSTEGYTAAELEQAKIAVRAKTQIPLNVSTATLGSASSAVELVQAYRVSGSTYHAIVPAQPILADWKSTAWIDITLGDKTVSYKAPATLGANAFEQLQAGKQVVITLNLSKEESGGQEIDWRNNVVWVYGLENMPPLSQWGYYDKPLGILGLEWQRQYGWYDCNKEAFLDPPVANPRDANMCWAATSSNLIHWWLDRHQQYLDRYGYKGPREYKDDIHAEVFDFYRDRFANKGQFIDDGIEYFFTGKVPPGESQPKPGVNHPGFFKDVFPNGRVTRTVYGSQNVSETIKQGLLNKEAIGLDIAVKAGKAAHAITIWGAGFDKDGKLNTLYVCENNDTFFATQSNKPMSPGKQCNAGIFPRRVDYDEWGNAWVESGSPGKYTIGVRALIFLGMKDKEFEAYFAKPENQGK